MRGPAAYLKTTVSAFQEAVQAIRPCERMLLAQEQIGPCRSREGFGKGRMRAEPARGADEVSRVEREEGFQVPVYRTSRSLRLRAR